MDPGTPHGPTPDLVTGEAVALEMRLAKLPSRGLAFAIDVLLQGAALLALGILVAAGAVDVDAALGATAALLLVVVVLVGYPVTMETLTRGRTVGKYALGLRVVRDDGGPIRFRQALTRGLAGFFVDFWALGMGGAVALIVSLFSVTGKRVGDVLAGTVVVRTRTPEATSAPVMPPHLAGWAAGVHLSALPDDLALAARQYLGRFRRMTEPARDAMGARLASEVAVHVGRPPYAVHPHDYLSAVLAERTARALRASHAAPPGPSQPWSAQPWSAQPWPSQQPPSQQPSPTHPSWPPPQPPGAHASWSPPRQPPQQLQPQAPPAQPPQPTAQPQPDGPFVPPS